MFLTLEDPRAKVQTSRDPLGAQPVWSRFGREVVTNLTTVSRAVRGFAVVLLGRYFGECFVEEDRAVEDDAVPIFLRFEQIAAYARHTRSDSDRDDLVLGVNRVRRFLNEHNGRVPIRDDASGFILSDQKTYGLWGLYSVSARVSGLLADGPLGLTPWTREFVEQEYMGRLRPVLGQLEKLVLKGGTLDTHKRKEPFTTVARLLTGKLSANERAFYGQSLRDAERVEGPFAPTRQRQLAELIRLHCRPDEGLGRADIVTLSTAARNRGENSLAEKLDRILRLEAILSPAECLFELMQARNGKSPAALAQDLVKHWGSRIPNLSASLEPLLSEIQRAAGAEQAELIHRCDHALSFGDYEEAIRAVLEWNRVVMAARGSAPWVTLKHGELDVRFRSAESSLPTGDELPQLWRNSYFIDALKDVTFQLEDGADAER